MGQGKKIFMTLYTAQIFTTSISARSGVNLMVIYLKYSTESPHLVPKPGGSQKSITRCQTKTK